MLAATFYLQAGSAQIPESYGEQLVQQRQFDSANMFMKAAEYEKALKLFSRLYDNPDFCLSSHKRSAICFLQLGQRRSALDQIEEAVRKGFELNFLLNSPELFPLKHEIETAYVAIRPNYLHHIDTAVRTEIYHMLLSDQSVRHRLRDKNILDQDSIKRIMRKVDSLNISKLRKIESKIGWPGVHEIGSYQTFGVQMPDVDLLVIHSSEADNIFFLASAIRKAQQGKASWRDPFGIMTNLCFRFDQDDGHVKLRDIFFKDDGHLDEESSFLQLMALANFMCDNEQRKLTLKRVQWKAAMPSLDLEQVKQFLIKNGVSESRIVVSDRMVFGKDDGLGKFRVVGSWNW